MDIVWHGSGYFGTKLPLKRLSLASLPGSSDINWLFGTCIPKHMKELGFNASYLVLTKHIWLMSVTLRIIRRTKEQPNLEFLFSFGENICVLDKRLAETFHQLKVWTLRQANPNQVRIFWCTILGNKCMAKFNVQSSERPFWVDAKSEMEKQPRLSALH